MRDRHDCRKLHGSTYLVGVICTSRARDGTRRDERDTRGGCRDSDGGDRARQDLAALVRRSEQAKPRRPQRGRCGGKTAEQWTALGRPFELGAQRTPCAEEERRNSAG
jgi:hypothetical protein